MITQDSITALVRDDLSAFIQRSFLAVSAGDKYMHNWHIDCIAEYLLACHNRDIKRLIINIPPSYMKSICCTVAFPAWVLGRNPKERIMCASYAQSLSIKHSIDTRHIMQTEWYKRAFPNTVLAPDQNEKSKFMTTERGQRVAVSVDGMATGDGGRLLIIDDPLSAAQANSITKRTNANFWFDNTMVSRLRDKLNGAIIVIMQRLHENDVTGHLLAKGGWEHLCLPAWGEREQRIWLPISQREYIRAAETPLHAERENKQALDRLQKDMGAYTFAGQYQQNPTPAEGGIFKSSWWKYYDEKPHDINYVVQSWDTAYKAAQLNDPSCGQTWGQDKQGNHYLLDSIVDRMEYPDLKRAVINAAEKHKPDIILIEDKASGQSLIQELRSTGLPIKAVEPQHDKITRAVSATPMVESGLVYLPRNALWLSAMESEFELFPNSTHDDQIDALAQYLNWHKKESMRKARKPAIVGIYTTGANQ